MLGVLLLAACGPSDTSPVLVGYTGQAVSSQSSVLGFEDPATWTVTQGTKSASSQRTEGLQSLAISDFTFTAVISAPLSTLPGVTSTWALDVQLPASPGWGQAQLFVSIPSRNVYYALAGTAVLAGLPGGSFQTIHFDMPPDVTEALQTVYDDLSIRITLNAPQTSQNLLLDNLRFVGPTSIDTDGDRLPDVVETNTGQFVSPEDTGTDPNDPDTDGDGLRDGDEVLGTAEGLDLPALGTSPLRKDILLEYDWFDDALDCGMHSHRPTPAQVQIVDAAFAAAPVPNPDGTTGVHVVHDYGQGGVFSGGNLIQDADGVIDGAVFSTEYQGYKAAHLAPSRFGYFHYVILPHRYYLGNNGGSSGYAEIVGDDMIVSHICWGQAEDAQVARTIMHELGHNLGLRHGGNINTNYKPNYNSVMNYRYQFPGVDSDCVLGGDGVTDYSYNSYAPLDETALDEAAGICGGVGIDWNRNAVIDGSLVETDINNDSLLQVLTDYHDWNSLLYDWNRVVQVQSLQDNPPCPGPATSL